jgi:tight adherence protein C
MLLQVAQAQRERNQARARMLGQVLAQAARPMARQALGQAYKQWALALEGRLKPAWRQALQTKLKAAGQAQRSPGSLLMQGLASALLLGLLGLLLGAGALIPLFFLGGAFLPLLSLEEASRRRLKALRRALPDALDLLVGCVEAGLAFDQALGRVVRRLPASPLKQELEHSLSQMRLGQPRREALKALGQRVALDELRSLASSLIQADQLGTPLAPVLRQQASQMRALRSLEAQRLAAQAPVKMLLPLMLFILPVVFLVLFGPIFLRWQSGGF